MVAAHISIRNGMYRIYRVIDNNVNRSFFVETIDTDTAVATALYFANRIERYISISAADASTLAQRGVVLNWTVL